MNSSVTVTETQLMVLSAASQREDRRVIMSNKLRGGVANKLLATLTTKGMIELIAKREEDREAPGAGLVGLTDYRISASGLARIGVCEVESGPAAADSAGQTSEPAPPKTRVPTSDVGAGGSPNRSPRAGSKLDQVIALLSSEKGATIDELISLTGWLPHTARAALTGLRHRGYDVRLDRADKARGSVYRVVLAHAIAP